MCTVTFNVFLKSGTRNFNLKFTCLNNATVIRILFQEFHMCVLQNDIPVCPYFEASKCHIKVVNPVEEYIINRTFTDTKSFS